MPIVLPYVEGVGEADSEPFILLFYCLCYRITVHDSDAWMRPRPCISEFTELSDRKKQFMHG